MACFVPLRNPNRQRMSDHTNIPDAILSAIGNTLGRAAIFLLLTAVGVAVAFLSPYPTPRAASAGLLHWIGAAATERRPPSKVSAFGHTLFCKIPNALLNISGQPRMSQTVISA